MPPDPSAVFAALGDPTRLRILASIGAGNGRSISELAAGAPISRQAVTKHLRVMEGAGLLTSERSGRQVRWRGNPAVLGAARGYLDRVAEGWEDALGRLKAHVEGEAAPATEVPRRKQTRPAQHR